MRPAGGLRRRVVWSTAAVTALAMAAVTVAVALVLATVARNDAESELGDRLALLRSAVGSSDDGRLTALTSPDDSVNDGTWVFDASGAQVQGPRAGARVQATAESLAAVDRRTQLEVRDRIYLAAPVRSADAGTVEGVVVVSESLEPYDRTRTQVLVGLAVLGLLVTAGSTATAWWTVHRALAPVSSMAARAEEWSEHDLESRFPLAGTGGDEIGVLGETLNHLLDRVAGALRTEQRLTAELAHELRTPLTAIRGEAELGLLGTSDPDVARRFTELVAQVERMDGTITTLLAMARGSDRRGTAGRPSVVVAAVLADRPPDPRVAVVVDVGADELVAAPTALAARALAPVVDNAVRHARSTVHVTVTARARTVDVDVTDDGAGLAGVDAEQAFVAGERGPGSHGTGLGLALARRVARTLGGDVTVVSEASPTTFRLTLPRA